MLIDSQVVTTSGLRGVVRTFNDEGDPVVELEDGQWILQVADAEGEK